jgi:hypothetical protein
MRGQPVKIPWFASFFFSTLWRFFGVYGISHFQTNPDPIIWNIHDVYWHKYIYIDIYIYILYDDFHSYIYYNMIYVITIFYILAMNLHSWWFPQLNNYASHRLVRRPARNLPVPVACLRTGEATPGCFKVSTVRGIIPKSPYFRLVNYDLRWFNMI